MLKNVMDKASERVKRSLGREGTYGMTLTGNKGVVWNVSTEECFSSKHDTVMVLCYL